MLLWSFTFEKIIIICNPAGAFCYPHLKKDYGLQTKISDWLVLYTCTIGAG